MTLDGAQVSDDRAANVTKLRDRAGASAAGHRWKFVSIDLDASPRVVRAWAIVLEIEQYENSGFTSDGFVIHSATVD